jgi:S1/P1 Nuclease
MVHSLTPILLAALPLFPSAHAWGTLGHDTVAYIATNFVKAETKTWAQGILSDNTTSYLANVATWADTFRYTKGGTFSAPFHYIDAMDSPPSSCSVDFDRDCGTGGCIVTAITNYVSLST